MIRRELWRRKLLASSPSASSPVRISRIFGLVPSPKRLLTSRRFESEWRATSLSAWTVSGANWTVPKLSVRATLR